MGAGALLDATSRGLRVALIEQDDIAAGTSSRSSRLIHGGLRYLEQFHIGLVREALAERRRLLRNAPHLVTLEPLLFPIYGIPFLHKAFYDAGLTLYDVLGARHDGGWHRRLSVDETLALAPGLRRRGLRGGLLYHDGMEDDARFTLAVVRTALGSDPAPVAVTRVRATGVRLAASGRVDAVHARDATTGAEVTIRTRAVVDATGVWAVDPAHPFSDPSMRLLPSRGAHLVVPRSRIPATTGLTIRVPGKVVFLVPWPDHWLIGTTDAPYSGRSDRPSADAWEVDELLATVNATLDVDLRREDIVGTYAGLRPLIAPADGSTVKASREHQITIDPNGVVRIGGGKYTTYRVMARDVVDTVLGRDEARARPSLTADRRLVGAAERDDLDRLARRARLRAGRGPGASRDGDPTRRPPWHRGARRRRAGWGAGPAAAARPRSTVPRGRGRLGGSPRARHVDRRRAVPPLAAVGRIIRRRSRSHRPAGWPRSWPSSLAGMRIAGPSRPRSTAPGRLASTACRRHRRPDRVIPPSRDHANLTAMPSIGDIANDVARLLYEFRIPVAIGSIGAVIAIVLVARRLGWFAAARRHPQRTAAFAAVFLAVSAPLAWYLGSPIFIRTSLVEPEPIVVASAPPAASIAPSSSPTTPAPSSPGTSPAPATPTPTAAPTPEPTPFAPVLVASGEFQGTDEFHFGRGTASIVEVAPGRYRVRLVDFSVRNGPDLYVYLSQKADGYTRSALEVGLLKATDGSFGYDLPAGTDPSVFKSALIWCKQFSHLFAVAPFRG